MKTIKLPNNISKINLYLPKKQYSKDHNIEQMMKTTNTKQQNNYCRPENAGKMIST